MKRSYTERRILRGAGGLWGRAERLLNRLTASPFNPLYHLGALSIFLLLVLTATGAYLTLFYRPGAERAYATVAAIDAQWLGGPMRSIHRYAADALIVTIVLHALKMLLSDRFWGSRWLAWVSGLAMLALLWAIGAMGYWLVWDQRAQWLTEFSVGLVGGPVALTFVSAAALAQATTFFIIILFLHVFLSVLIALGLLLHLLRLARPQIWSPRWLIAEALLALAILAAWRPATSAPPADPSRLVGGVTLDSLYLGFVPLAERWGAGPMIGLSLLVGLAALALPWLARGRSQGPAQVVEANCTGCTICVQECPYGAIEMRTLPAGSRYPALAVVSPSLCTGCGLCVGACATDGIELPGVRAGGVRERLRHSVAASSAPVVVFACQGHLALGTLGRELQPKLEREQPQTHANEAEDQTLRARPRSSASQIEGTEHEQTQIDADGAEGQAVRVRPRSSASQIEGMEHEQTQIDADGAEGQAVRVRPRSSASQINGAGLLQGARWGGLGQIHTAQRTFGGAPLTVLACALPCVGMVQPEMIRDSLTAGARAVVVVTGPDHDCGFREGPHWLVERLGRRKSLVGQGVHVLAAPTGDHAALDGLLARFAHGQAPPADQAPPPAARARRALGYLAGLLALLLGIGLTLALELPFRATPADQSLLRIGLAHPGQIKTAAAGLSESMQSKLPTGVAAEQLVGGERFPVHIRVEVDGTLLAERAYTAGGLRQEGAAYGLESWPLAPGRHQLRLWMMDDGATWRAVFDGPAELAAGRVLTLIYDGAAEAFVVR